MQTRTKTQQFKYDSQERLSANIVPLTLAISTALSVGTTPAWADQRGGSTITVNVLDAGFVVDACSLRAAIATANSGTQFSLCDVPTSSPVTISFLGSLNGTISESSRMDIDVPLIIDGSDRITVEVSEDETIFNVREDAESFTLKNMTLSGGSSGQGPGIISVTQHLTIEGSTFTGFDSLANGGAVLHLAGSLADSSLNIHGSEFIGNYADGRGGAVLADVTGTVSITDSEFRENEAKYSGGAVELIISGADEATLSNNVFFDNLAGDGNGGAIDLSVSNSDVSIGGVFELNTASDSGGAIRASVEGGLLTLDDARFAQNYADNGGGGLAFSADGADLAIIDSEFYYNGGAGVFGNSDGLGGGVLLTDATAGIDIQRTRFQGNRAYAGGGLAIDAPASGVGNRILSNSELSNNLAEGGGNGAGVFLRLAPNQGFTIASTTLSGNTGAEVGGGVFVASEQTSLAAKYSTLAFNAAEVDGGGIAFGPDSGNATVINSILQNYADFQPQDTVGSNINIQSSLVRGAANSSFNDIEGNILDQEAGLLPLAFNGGNGGRTHRLQSDSPAIDAGQAESQVPDFDQRGPGFPRITGGGLDMGAHELQTSGDAIFGDRFEP